MTAESEADLAIERYDPDRHGSEFRSWCAAWGLPETAAGLVPQFGVIAPGVACAFLYRTDSPVCHIDLLLSAPGIDDDLRDRAIDTIVSAIIATATELGFTRMYAHTALSAVVERAERHGFVFTDDPVSFGIRHLA